MTYDQTGDRLSKSGSGLATGAYSYNPGTHQLIATGNAVRTVDANGNATGLTQAGSTYSLSYNDRNRLATVQEDTAAVGTYTYNALGQRIQKVTSTDTERFNYDETNQLLAEYGSMNRDYVWMEGIPVATVDTQVSTATVRYVTADQLGTPRAIADAGGNSLWQWAYQGNMWGELAPTDMGYTSNLRFPGQYFDAETGLSNNVNRYYDSGVGRYDQPDPSGLKGGINPYVYGLNDPLAYIDPLGLCPGDNEPTGEKKINPGPKWCPAPFPPGAPLNPKLGYENNPSEGCRQACLEKATNCMKRCLTPGTVAMCEEAWRIKVDECAIKANGG